MTLFGFGEKIAEAYVLMSFDMLEKYVWEINYCSLKLTDTNVCRYKKNPVAIVEIAEGGACPPPPFFESFWCF